MYRVSTALIKTVREHHRQFIRESPEKLCVLHFSIIFLIVTFCEQYGWLKMQNGMKGHDDGLVYGTTQTTNHEAIPSMWRMKT